MIRRLLAVLSVPAVVAASLSGVAPATGAAPAPSAFKVVAPVAFSPDGNGVKDRVAVRVKLPNAADRVDLEVTSYYGREVVRATSLRDQPEGVSVWTWDGRSDGGKKLPDGPYVIEATVDWADPGVSAAPRRDVVFLDTEFDPRLSAPSYGVAAKKATHRVFPRTTVVRDALPLDARVHEDAVKTMRLVIRNDRGRVVRDDDVNREIEESDLGSVPATGGGLRELKAHGRTVRWSGRRGAKPLPSGRYTAVVTGKDRAGNTGRSETIRIFVSRDKLVWKGLSSAVAPASSTTSSCDFFPGYRCGGDLPPCGQVVASTMFPGGFSYRSGVKQPSCSDDRARQLHALAVPETAGVRGVDSARISFTGAATNAGEQDTGTLSLIAASPVRADDREVTGTSGTTESLSNLWIGGGIDSGEGTVTVPSVVWAFETTADNWVDVASFTVDYRYLAIER